MSRKLLQIAVVAAVLTAGSLFFFRDVPPSAPAGSSPIPDAQVAASILSTTPSEGAEAEHVASTESPAVSPSQLLDDALRRIPDLPPLRKDSFIEELIAQLRAAGIPGLRAVTEFLRSGRDVHVHAELTIASHPKRFSSLRLALIDALGNWEGALPINLEILQSNASIWETILAIRNLELEFPGTYRAQAIEAVRRQLRDIETVNFGAGGADYLFATVSQLQATEFLPILEHFVNRSRSMADEYLEMLNTFPEDARRPAFARLFESPEMRSFFASHPNEVKRLSFRDESVRSAIVDLFANEMNAGQRLAMLRSFEPAPMGTPLLFVPLGKTREAEQARSKLAVEEARSRKGFLQTARDAIALLPKEPSTPVIESAINEAQKRITDDLAKRVVEVRLESNPAVEVDFADGTGKAQIKGRRIEAIELLAPAVVQPAPSEDSTDSPDR